MKNNIVFIRCEKRLQYFFNEKKATGRKIILHVKFISYSNKVQLSDKQC